jgi:hypothetical protein
MKKLFSIISIVSAVTIIASCNLSNDNQPAVNKSTVCFTVVDASNDNPVDSAYVRLTIRSLVTNIYSSLIGLTDASGKCCFEYEVSSLYGVVVEKKGFVTFMTDKGIVPTTIRLTPAPTVAKQTILQHVF